MNGFKELDAYFQLPKKNIGSGLVAKVMSNSCNHRDCSLPGSSVYVISQARILEWVAISFSRRYSQPKDCSRVSHIVGRRITIWATREVLGLQESDTT